MCLLRYLTTYVLMILIVLILNGCQGYQLGAPSLYHEEIRTVHVRMAQVDSWRANLGERLTEAVCKRITDRTPFQLADAGKADSELVIKLVAENQEVSALNRYNDTRQKTLNWTVVAVWTDKRRNVLGELEPIPLNQNGVTIDGRSYLVAEMGQSGATAQQELIDKLANQIVDLMEQPW